MAAEGVAQWAGVATTAWAVVSGLLNVVFWFKTPGEWVTFAEARPRTAALIRFVRATGLDPKKALIALRDFASQSKRLPPKTSLRPPGTAPSTAPVALDMPVGDLPNLQDVDEAALTPKTGAGTVYLDPQTDRVERKEPP